MNPAQQKGTDILVQGRIVWGGVKAQVKKNYKTKQPEIDVKTGQQKMENAFGLAIPKPNPSSSQHEKDNFMLIWNAIHTEAGKFGFQPGALQFAWKFIDGDGKKKDGTAYADHSRGHIVFTCKTIIPLKLCAWENGVLVQVTEKDIKCGDYVQVALNISAHGGNQDPNPGMYINPSYVARFAFGPEIVNTPDPETIFGTQAPAIPAGGSASPMGFAAPGSPQQFGQQPQQGPAPVQFQGYQAPIAQPQAAPAPMQYQPNTAVLPPAFQQQPAQAPAYPQQTPMAQPGYPPQQQQFMPPVQPQAQPAYAPQQYQQPQQGPAPVQFQPPGYPPR